METKQNNTKVALIYEQTEKLREKFGVKKTSEMNRNIVMFGEFMWQQLHSDKMSEEEVVKKFEEFTLPDPYVSNAKFCKSCGNEGKVHPSTSNCYVCGADNWEDIKFKQWS